jgi:heme exporter protein B
MKMSNTAFADVIQVGLWQIVLLLVALDVLVIALAVILFPFLWKD